MTSGAWTFSGQCGYGDVSCSSLVTNSSAIDSSTYDSSTAYPQGSIVLHDGLLYYAKVGWAKTADLTNGNLQVAFTQLGMEWVANGKYTLNQVVSYNNQLYRLIKENWNAGTIAPAANSQYWKVLSPVDYVSGTAYPGTTSAIVKYDGQYYIVTNWSDASTPPNQSYAFTRVNAFNSSVSYGVNSVVLYQSSLYKLSDAAQAQGKLPGQSNSGWNQIDNLTYQTTNTYQNYDVAYYNTYLYQVIDAAKANSATPGTANSGWNRIDTIVYQANNVYANEALVVSGNYVYLSLKNDNTSPLTDTNAWKKVTTS